MHAGIQEPEFMTLNDLEFSEWLHERITNQILQVDPKAGTKKTSGRIRRALGLKKTSTARSRSSKKQPYWRSLPHMEDESDAGGAAEQGGAEDSHECNATCAEHSLGSKLGRGMRIKYLNKRYMVD